MSTNTFWSLTQHYVESTAEIPKLNSSSLSCRNISKLLEETYCTISKSNYMQMHVRAIWKLEEVHLIWRVMCVALGPTVVLTPEPTLWDVWFPRYEHFRKNFFLVKKSKFWLRSPPEAPETPEMDCNMPHWRPLNDLSPRIDQKNGKKEGRGKRDGFRWVFSGGLVGGFTLVR